MRLEANFQQQVAAALALPGKADDLPGPDSGRNVDLKLATIESDPLPPAGIGQLQRNQQVGTAVPGRPAPPDMRLRPTAMAEQRFEKVAETAAVAELGLEAVLPTGAKVRWRTELLARPVTTRLELIVGRALVGVAQHLVGLVDRLEALFGARLLADIRVVFAGQTPVGGLEFSLSGARLDAERLVVILEFHGALV